MIGIPTCLLNLAGQPGSAVEITMTAKVDDLRERIAAFVFPRGLEVVRAKRGYTLYSRRTIGPVARLRPDQAGRQGSGPVVAK
jgi:hypothetical protein